MAGERGGIRKQSRVVSGTAMGSPSRGKHKVLRLESANALRARLGGISLRMTCEKGHSRLRNCISSRRSVLRSEI
jgi:hypothetical protein